MSKKQNVNIMVDLDCVVDTRLPLIYTLYKEIVPTIMKDDYYRKRAKDTFGNMSYDIFRTIYKRRNKNILRLATATPMIGLLHDFATEALTAFLTDELTYAPIVYLNIYPYDLSEEEKIILFGMLDSLLPDSVNVKIVSYSNTELTPKFVDNELYALIKYDMLEWLEYHNSKGNLPKYPLLETMCIAPMIANGNKKTKDLTQEDFTNLIEMFSPLVRLIFIQTRYFSST